MERFNRGQAVWVFWQNRFGYPEMHHRPGVVQKRIHPTSYLVAFVANDPGRYQTEWKLDRKGKQRHPSDLLDHAADPGAHLRALRAKWRQEADPAVIAEWEKEEAARKKMNDDINRKLRPIFARMCA